jgi:hypothetical protein
VTRRAPVDGQGSPPAEVDVNILIDPAVQPDWGSRPQAAFHSFGQASANGLETFCALATKLTDIRSQSFRISDAAFPYLTYTEFIVRNIRRTTRPSGKMYINTYIYEWDQAGQVLTGPPLHQEFRQPLPESLSRDGRYMVRVVPFLEKPLSPDRYGEPRAFAVSADYDFTVERARDSCRDYIIFFTTYGVGPTASFTAAVVNSNVEDAFEQGKMYLFLGFGDPFVEPWVQDSTQIDVSFRMSFSNRPRCDPSKGFVPGLAEGLICVS